MHHPLMRKRVFPLGDGRYSSGSPVPCPAQDSGPDESQLHAGRRVWVFRGGEWTERVLTGWSGGYAYVAPLHSWEGEARPTQAHLVSLEKPHDCGALVPLQGSAGVQWWLERDPTIFANVHGIGAQVQRPPILWDAASYTHVIA